MTNPIRRVHTSDAQQIAPPATKRTAKTETQVQTPPVQKSGAVSQDQVTLKSAGQVDSADK